MRFLGVLGAGLMLFSVACGGGGDDDDGGPGPNNNQTLNEIQASVTQLNLTAGGTQTINMTARDTQGATISNPGNYTFQSANTAVAQVSNQGTVLGIAAGTTSINISLTRQGVTKTASVPVTVTGTLPATAQVSAGSANTFDPQIVAITRGGTVTWNIGAVQHNVTFGSAQPQGGNIASTSNANVSRTFPNAGDYPYDCTLHAGMSGTVFVR